MDIERSGSYLIDGAEGQIEIIVDVPAIPAVGMCIVAHPQPILGGSARHKVPHFLARALRDAGWLVVRPNFRGVGGSTGVHDEGRGETRDVLELHDRLRAQRPDLRMVLVGFSFGAFVQACVASALAERGEPAWRVFLAGMPWGEVDGGRNYDTPHKLPDALVIHGEKDERVPLSAVMDWARPEQQPVVVVPDADHFFTGRLPLLRQQLLGWLAA